MNSEEIKLLNADPTVITRATTFQATFTNKGAELLLQAIEKGKKLIPTSIIAGDGRSDGLQWELSNLINSIDLKILMAGHEIKSINDELVLLLQAQITNALLTVPVYVREIGYFVNDVMLIYAWLPSDAEGDAFINVPEIEGVADRIYNFYLPIKATNQQLEHIVLTFSVEGFVTWEMILELIGEAIDWSALEAKIDSISERIGWPTDIPALPPTGNTLFKLIKWIADWASKLSFDDILNSIINNITSAKQAILDAINNLKFDNNISFDDISIARRRQFIVPGTYQWTVPNRVSKIYVTACAGGGFGGFGMSISGGNTVSGSGGGGGDCIIDNEFKVTPKSVLTIIVGEGGHMHSIDGKDTSISTLFTLKGGTHGNYWDFSGLDINAPDVYSGTRPTELRGGLAGGPGGGEGGRWLRDYGNYSEEGNGSDGYGGRGGCTSVQKRGFAGSGSAGICGGGGGGSLGGGGGGGGTGEGDNGLGGGGLYAGMNSSSKLGGNGVFGGGGGGGCAESLPSAGTGLNSSKAILGGKGGNGAVFIEY